LGQCRGCYRSKQNLGSRDQAAIFGQPVQTDDFVNGDVGQQKNTGAGIAFLHDVINASFGVRRGCLVNGLRAGRLGIGSAPQQNAGNERKDHDDKGNEKLFQTVHFHLSFGYYHYTQISEGTKTER